MEEIKEQLSALTKEAACKLSTAQLIELYNTVDPKELDISPLELVIVNAFGHGTMWQAAVTEKQEANKTKQSLDSGIWLAITEIAFYPGYKGLIEDIIKAVGFSYDECIELMDISGCNNDVLQPIVDNFFFEDEEDEELNNNPEI